MSSSERAALEALAASVAGRPGPRPVHTLPREDNRCVVEEPFPTSTHSRWRIQSDYSLPNDMSSEVLQEEFEVDLGRLVPALTN